MVIANPKSLQVVSHCSNIPAGKKQKLGLSTWFALAELLKHTSLPVPAFTVSLFSWHCIFPQWCTRGKLVTPGQLHRLGYNHQPNLFKYNHTASSQFTWMHICSPCKPFGTKNNLPQMLLFFEGTELVINFSS